MTFRIPMKSQHFGPGTSWRTTARCRRSRGPLRPVHSTRRPGPASPQRGGPWPRRQRWRPLDRLPAADGLIRLVLLGKSEPETRVIFPWNMGLSGSNFPLNQSIDGWGEFHPKSGSHRVGYGSHGFHSFVDLVTEKLWFSMAMFVY